MAARKKKQNDALIKETYSMRTIKRSELKAAPYNPREIDDAAKKKLKASLVRHGVVTPLIYNKQTSHIVGGHQRIAIMDDVHQGEDYELTIAEIDVPEKQEKEINIALNNDRAMGFFNMDQLSQLLPDLDALSCGFDTTDMIRMFGENAVEKQNQSFAELAEKVKENTEKYEKDIKPNIVDRDNQDYYLVYVFPSYQARKQFTDSLQEIDNRFQDGLSLARKLGVNIDINKKEVDEEQGIVHNDD